VHQLGSDPLGREQLADRFPVAVTHPVRPRKVHVVVAAPVHAGQPVWVHGLGPVQCRSGVEQIDEDPGLLDPDIGRPEEQPVVLTVAPQLACRTGGNIEEATALFGVVRPGRSLGGVQVKGPPHDHRLGGGIAQVSEGRRRIRRKLNGRVGLSLHHDLNRHRGGTGSDEQVVTALRPGKHGSVGCDPAEVEVAVLPQLQGGQAAEVGQNTVGAGALPTARFSGRELSPVDDPRKEGNDDREVARRSVVEIPGPPCLRGHLPQVGRRVAPGVGDAMDRVVAHQDTAELGKALGPFGAVATRFGEVGTSGELLDLHPERLRHLKERRDRIDLALATLDLGNPALGAVEPHRQALLGEAPQPAVQRDALPDGHAGRGIHVASPPASCAPIRPGARSYRAAGQRDCKDLPPALH
jgi:hypothetical protein